MRTPSGLSYQVFCSTQTLVSWTLLTTVLTTHSRETWKNSSLNDTVPCALKLDVEPAILKPTPSFTLIHPCVSLVGTHLTYHYYYTYLYYSFTIGAVSLLPQPHMADPNPYAPLWMNPFGPYPPNLHFFPDQVESLTNMLPPYSITGILSWK